MKKVSREGISFRSVSLRTQAMTGEATGRAAVGSLAGLTLLMGLLVLLPGCTRGPVRQAARQAAGLMDEGRTEEALAAYRQAQELDSSAAVLHFGEGLALYKLERYKEAEPPLREAIRFESSRGRYHLYLGHVLAHLERLDEAVEAYEDATEADPRDAAAWRALGF
ncbi:MAG: tetratricopeptide repeat protein, partial [Acidobacteriota bacterium]